MPIRTSASGTTRSRPSDPPEVVGLSVAIVGGGIGGLTAAIALSPIADEIKILEKRTGFGETGAGIQLSPNASRILIDLGLGPVLRRIGAEPSGIVVRSFGSGRQIAAIELGAEAEARFGAPYLHVARADLQTALLDVVRSRGNIRLRVGRDVLSAEWKPDRAVLTYAGASAAPETIETDLVVGADGLWSRVRESVGDTRRPIFSGFVASRTTLSADRLDPALRETGGLWLGRGRHVVHYPLASGRLVNVVAVRSAVEASNSSTAERPDAVQAAFAGAAAPLRDLLAAGESWSDWSLFDVPAQRLAYGRIALLGDAGHPALPFLAQGGALAIEDGAVLASELRRSPCDVKAALRSYERKRLARVKRVQAAARRNAGVYHCSGPIALARNLVMRRLGPAGMRERYAWIYGWRPDAA